MSVVIARNHALSIWTITVGVLQIIALTRIRLPDLDFTFLDGAALGIFDGADRKKRIATRIPRHE